jgi:hypothetical protein
VKRAVLAVVMVCGSVAAFSAALEVTSGVSALLYQSVFSYQLSMAVETSVSGDLAGPLSWGAGARVGIDPLLPEASPVPRLDGRRASLPVEMEHTGVLRVRA